MAFKITIAFTIALLGNIVFVVCKHIGVLFFEFHQFLIEYSVCFLQIFNIPMCAVESYAIANIFSAYDVEFFHNIGFACFNVAKIVNLIGLAKFLTFVSIPLGATQLNWYIVCTLYNLQCTQL